MCIRTVTYVCREGHYYSEQPPQGIQSSNGWCHPCSDGSFMDSGEHNERQCRPCRKCNGAPDEYYKRQCDKIADSECAFCPPGQLTAPDGRCQSPTTKSLADPITTSASTTNAKTTAKTTTTASETSKETRDPLTSNDGAHSEWSRVSQAASKSSRSDGDPTTTSASTTNAKNTAKTASAASATFSDTKGPLTSNDSTHSEWSQLSQAANKSSSNDGGTKPLTVSGDDIPMDARVTALAVTSVISTVMLVTLVAFWLKRRGTERHEGSSSTKLSCCSCVLSPHVYQEPYEYDATYLEAPQHDDSSRSSISSASPSGSHTYDYVRPYGSSHLAGNSSVNSSLLDNGRGDPGERHLCYLQASDSETLGSDDSCCLK